MSKLFQKLKKERERIEKDKSSRGGGNFEKINWWKPEKGDNLIRILPDLNDPDENLPFRRVAVHFINVTTKDGNSVKVSVRCLNDFEEGTCPICDAYERLVKKDKEKARELRARDTYIYNVIDYKTKTIHPWSAGITIHDQIMGFAEDFSDNIFSMEAGRDWKIVKKVDPRKPRHLGVDYSVRPSTKDSAMPEKLKPLIESAIDLDKLYSEREEEKMIQFLEAEGFTVGGTKKAAKAAEEEEEGLDLASEFGDEEEAPKKPAAKGKPAAKAKPVDDEDDGPASDFGDFDEEEAPKKAAKPAAKAAAKKRVEEDDEDLADIDTGDDDVEQELRDLGVI